jgi:VanZ family protein
MTVASTPHLRRLGLVLTILSLAAIAYATLLPEPGRPLDAHLCLVCGSLGGVDAILNVLLFIPLGVGLALSGVPCRRALLTMSVLSVLIETAQFFVIPGRDATIGDVLTNTLGGALGIAIGRYPQLWFRPPPRIARSIAMGWGAMWLAIQIVSNFGFTLSLPDSQYYGQIARVLGDYALFHGLVLSASVDDVQIPNTALVDSRKVQQLLGQGANIATTVVAAEPTLKVAPIVRVADANKNEIVLLAQTPHSYVFGVHNGAAVLHLRPTLFALAGAFSARVSTALLPNDTLRLRGRYAAGEVTLTIQSGSESRDRRIPLIASLGWTFLLPFQWFIEGTPSELVVSWIWIAGLAIPLGYWLFRSNDSSRSQGTLRKWSPVFLGVVALLWAGLVLVPQGFGLSAAPLRDWLATFAGVLIGAGLSALIELIGNRELA